MPDRAWHARPVLITPLPGADRRNVREALRWVLTKTSNLASSAAKPSELCLEYLRWSADIASHLRGQISAPDIDRLILTRRHWSLQQVITLGNLAGMQGAHIAQLVRIEVEER